MRSVVLALCLSSAAAFMPAPAASTSSALHAVAKAIAKPAAKIAAKPAAKPAAKIAAKFAVKPAAKPVAKIAGKKAVPVVAKKTNSYADELGAQKPLGFYDPLGLVTNVDQERFDRLRGVEIKHGRVSMLAFLGHVTTSNGVHFSGNIQNEGTGSAIAFADIKPGLAAFDTLPSIATLQIVLFIGFLEAFVMKDVTGLAEFPGDFRNGFIDFGWDTFSDATKYVPVLTRMCLCPLRSPAEHSHVYLIRCRVLQCIKQA
jgi:hypothetical protein